MLSLGVIAILIIYIIICIFSLFFITPFVLNAPSFYPLKTGGREKVHWEQMG